MTKDRFKEITLDNWLEPDDVPLVDPVPISIQDEVITPLSPDE